MRVHFILTPGPPENKLAEVEIHFEEGPLAGMKLVGFSVWKSKKGEGKKHVVLVPTRSFATPAGTRYFELLRDSEGSAPGSKKNYISVLKQLIRDEYQRIIESAAE
jgi:hypothetical protein